MFFPFVYHACGPISRARFSQSHQGLILADIIKVKLSIITRRSPLFRNPPIAICQLRWKSGKRTMNPATAGNSAFSLFRHFQPFTRSVLFFLLNPWEVFLRTLFSCFETSQIVEPSTMNEERLSGLGMLLIHRRTNFKRPESKVIYKLYQDWGKWPSQASF